MLRQRNKGSLKLLFKKAEDRAKRIRKEDSEMHQQMERQTSNLSQATDDGEVPARPPCRHPPLTCNAPRGGARPMQHACCSP